MKRKTGTKKEIKKPQLSWIRKLGKKLFFLSLFVFLAGCLLAFLQGLTGFALIKVISDNKIVDGLFGFSIISTPVFFLIWKGEAKNGYEHGSFNKRNTNFATDPRYSSCVTNIFHRNK